jgi:TolB protein
MGRAAAIGSAFVALLAFVPAAHAAFPGVNGEISYAHTNSTNTQSDVYTIDQWGEGPETNITNQSYSRFSAWSPSGDRIAFSQNDKIYTADPDGSQKTLVLDWTSTVWDLDWSPDSAKLVAELWTCDTEECHQDIYTMNLDGTGLTNITGGNGFDDRHPAWSPDGTKIAFDSTRNGESGIYTMNPNGSGETQLTQNTTSFDGNPDWSPDATRLVFERGGYLVFMNADGSQLDQKDWTGSGASWSPDGEYIATAGIRVWPVNGLTNARLVTSHAPSAPAHADLDTDWRPRPAVNPPPTGSGYPRMKGASPLEVFFVPAYEPCTASNRTHGPPLAFPSCAPPVRTSVTTIGTADSNGQPTQAIGKARFGVLAGTPGGPDDADVTVDVSQTDVRLGGDFSDYQGEMDLRVPVRITDKWNGNGSDASATVTDLPLRITVPCRWTDLGNIGAECQISTTIEAVYPNAVRESKRSVWEFGRIELYNGGPDRVASTAPGNRLFAVQGVFVP